MIVSHKHRLIFLKPRKVAGTSFEIAISRFLSEADIITPLSRDDELIRRRLGFIGPRNFNFGYVNLFSRQRDKPMELFGFDVPLKFYNHIPARVARRRLGHPVWSGYKKISLVRNPWERAISIFFWKNTKRRKRPNLQNFTTYFQEHEFLLETNYEHYMIRKRDVIDYFIRYENFEEDILNLENEVPGVRGLWDTFKGIAAKSETRDRSHTRQEIFEANPEINALVEKRNTWEIDRFGYRL